MGSISLPDTAVIDISVLQTMVNAINRLDSQVSELFETFVDIAYSDNDPSTTAWNSGYNPTVHQIQFGSTKIDSALFESETSGGATFYTATKEDLPFNVAFADGTKPVITLGVHCANTTNEMSANIVSFTNTAFTVKVKATTGGNNAYLKWVAVGTRA